MPAKDHPLLHAIQPFVIGGVSGMVATTCIQPIDMIKTTIQLSEGSTKATPLTVFRQFTANGRILSLYQGLSAALLRQVVYGTSRLGFFATFENAMKRRAVRKGTSYGFVDRALAGLAAGALGATIGNPAEVALIRMQSDAVKPVNQRKAYGSAIHALVAICRTEGVAALWSGCLPTVIRAMATNFGQLTFFSEAKNQLQMRTELSQQMVTVNASAIAGFFAAFFSLPFDFAKTRLQQQSRSKDGSAQYKGMADCFIKVARDEGVLRFYRGFTPYFFRIAPHSIITLILADELTSKLRHEDSTKM